MSLAPSPELTEWTLGILTPGICSVTLPGSGVDDVVGIAAAAGLTGIEWGMDSHIRDLASAAHAREATAAAGLKVLSLGSYYRAGSFGDFDAVVGLAVELGAPRIRIWAGSTPSADADGAAWNAVVEDAQRIAALAAVHGITIAFEYHGGTLTDAPEATMELLSRVDNPNVGTYWQPAPGLTDQQTLASLHTVLERVVGVHCFSWWPYTERMPLTERKQLWRAISDVLRCAGRDLDVMLEFVADDDPDNVIRDAAYLNYLATGVAPA
jgi:sugar phosphate isomerase/epimerase